MKKTIITISAIVVVLVITLTGAAAAYSNSADYKSDMLPDNITINGVDCSELTYEQAAAKLTKNWNNRHITVVGSLNEELAAFSDYGFSYDISKQLENVKSDHLVSAAANHFANVPMSVTIPMIVSEYDETFKETVTTAEFLNKENSTSSADAYVDTTDPDFPIVPEVYGTEPNREKFFDDLTTHIQTGDLTFQFDERNYYSMPEVTAEDPSLKEYQKYCKEYLTQKITYQLGEETFTLTVDQLKGLLKDDLSGEANEEAVAAFVAGMAAQFDNVGVDRHFTGLNGKEIKVSGGTYGWKIDQAQETAQLAADINSHKDISREPIFSHKGYGAYSRNLGDSYIDVDLSSQTVTLFIDGRKDFSSPCVTGCPAWNMSTNQGTYYILNKIRNVTLRGENVDGSPYERFVNYWMGINWSSEGFHDAWWRSSFGGGIYRTNGSHGCVNMPANRIPELYNKVEVGFPIVVHY